MQRDKYKKDYKTKKYFSMKGYSDDSDTEWKPSKIRKKKYGRSLDGKYSEELPSFRESGEEIEIGKTNSCPVCSKLFSRNAALMCHIKQNHSYMLKKHQAEISVHSMKKDAIEWENRVVKEDKHSVSGERRYDTTNGMLNKDSSNEISSDNSMKAGECFEDFDDDENDDDKFPIIGGSFIGDGDEKIQPACANMSFDSTNSELLDPDQSFSIVRRGVRRQKKIQSSRIFDNVSVECGNEDNIEFASIDFSIDNSDDNRKVFKCYVCNECFSSSVLLTYHHMRKHMRSEFQQCPDCGSVYYDTVLFTAHTNLHRKYGRSSNFKN